MDPFSKAKNLARSSNFKRARVGCVLAIKRRKIIGGAVNTDKTHRLQKYYNIVSNRFEFDAMRNDVKHSMHAEIRALSALKKYNGPMSDVHIYVYRELKDGTIAMARPCPACMRMIKDMGIKHIHYSTPDGYAHEVVC